MMTMDQHVQNGVTAGIRKTTGLHTAAIRALPLAPITMVCRRLALTLARRHPDAFLRMGAYADSRFLFNPTDLPFCFAFHAGDGRPELRPTRSPAPEKFDAIISGSIAALWRMARAEGDGDALFFSREITISGNTEAVLALRNAMDDMETDMLDEILESLGPLTSPARLVLGLASRAHHRTWGGLVRARDALIAPVKAQNEALGKRLERLEQAQSTRTTARTTARATPAKRKKAAI